jgi:hypothetical protein
MHHFCALPPAPAWTRLGVLRLAQPPTRVAPDFGQFLAGANPRPARVFGAFHRQMPLFRKLMLEMSIKYKMLWFFVDMHHRQRYFFICGLKNGF